MSTEAQQEEVRDGQEATLLLSNKLLKDALAGVEKAYLEASLEVPVEDDISRFRFLEGIKVARMVAQHLEFYVKNGQLSAFELERLDGNKTH
ncbi:MAG: hypothetical protein KAS66_05265 [Candidatus Omnitrophica bacterium]|nr:hypothetical protein [Candidatus Omnitrophota bacterium]